MPTGEVQIVEVDRGQLAIPDNPAESIERAQVLVAAMSDKCSGEQFISHIQGRKYPRVEWWTTVGSVMGVYARERSCEICTDWNGNKGYLAEVEIVDRSGAIVGLGSAMCSTSENRWQNADEFQVRSMAITRATGKAFRLSFSFLPVLAGLEATPAEEMTHEDHTPPPAANLGGAPKPPAPSAGPKDVKGFFGVIDVVERKKGTNEKTGDWTLYEVVCTGGEAFRTFSDTHATVAYECMSGGIKVALHAEPKTRGKFTDMNIVAIRPMVESDVALMAESGVEVEVAAPIPDHIKQMAVAEGEEV